MIIPSYHQGAMKNTSLKKMKERFPAAYQYSINRKGWICHYVSDEPSYALSEAWLKKLTISKELPDSWCLIDSLGEDTVFFMWVLGGVVQVAKSCMRSSVEPVLVQRANLVFISNKEFGFLLPNAVKKEEVEPLTTGDLKPFALKPKAFFDFRWVGLGVISVVALSMYFLMQKPESKAPLPVDPYIAYRQSVDSAVSANSVINASVALASYGALLPDGWTLLSIDLQNQNLTLSASRDTTGTRPVIKQWLEYHKAIEPHSTVTLDALSISLPMTESLSDWTDKFRTVDPLSGNLIDAFVSLGWKVASPVRTVESVSSEVVFEVKKDIYLNELQSVAKLIRTIPISISGLQIKPLSATGQFKVSLTLRLIGAMT